MFSTPSSSQEETEGSILWKRARQNAGFQIPFLEWDPLILSFLIYKMGTILVPSLYCSLDEVSSQ